MDAPLVAGIELGGTKSIAILGRGRQVVDRLSVPTTDADATLAALHRQLSFWMAAHRPAAIGIASFGPISVDPAAPDHGRMLATPKPGWSQAQVLQRLASDLAVPCAIQTDVNAAAMAEGLWGAAEGLQDFVYVTVGTGIGFGVIAGGRPVMGALHPEAGHLRIRRQPGDSFAGICPFHGDCLEGLASGPAISARIGRPASELPHDDPVWHSVADALAEAMAVTSLVVAPRRILVGGGVGLGNPQLLPLVRAALLQKLGGYLPWVTAAGIDSFVAVAGLGADAGPLGALAVAAAAL